MVSKKLLSRDPAPSHSASIVVAPPKVPDALTDPGDIHTSRHGTVVPESAQGIV